MIWKRPGHHARASPSRMAGSRTPSSRAAEEGIGRLEASGHAELEAGQGPAAAGAGETLAAGPALLDRDRQVAPLDEQSNTERRSAVYDDALGLRRLGGGDRHAAANDRGLLGGDLRERRAENSLMVEVDACDHGDLRRAHRGRVEAPAEIGRASCRERV